MIATGGTIASKESGHGLHPALNPFDLLCAVPEVRNICSVDTVQLMNLDSTDISPENWLQMAKTIEDNYQQYDSFVITHGTDTMAYTAAALSYLIQNSPKAIVLTGAQKSISLSDTDARSNLIDSFIYAADENSQGVTIVFNGKVILGTRARKERTRSYNAFSSVDYPEVAIIREKRIIRYLERKVNPDGYPTFQLALRHLLRPRGKERHEDVETQQHRHEPEVSAFVREIEEHRPPFAARMPYIDRRPYDERNAHPQQTPLEELACRTPHGEKQVRRSHHEKRDADAADALRHGDPHHVPPACDGGDVRLRSAKVERLGRMDHHHHEAGDHAHPVKEHDSFH